MNAGFSITRRTFLGMSAQFLTWIVVRAPSMPPGAAQAGQLQANGYGSGAYAQGLYKGLFADVVPDCIIDSQDIQTTAARWRQREADPGWDSRFDLDSTGAVDTVDIMRVAGRLGDRCS